MKSLTFHNVLTLLCGLSLAYASSYGQSVDSLLRRAYAENPELKAMVLDFESATIKAEQMSQLSAPTVGVATPISPVETRLGPQVLMVSASQMLPWFGTLSAKEDVALSMSKAVYENYTALKLEVEYNIRMAYLSLQFLAEKSSVLEQKETLLQSFRSIALIKVESGQSTIADVLRIEIQLEEIKEKLLSLEQKTGIYKARINKELHEEVSTPISIVKPLQLSVLDSISIEAYRQKIQQYHPLLKRIDALIETSEKEQKLSKLKGRPQLAFGMDYGIVNERTDASPIDNGRDVFIPKVMISIPIYRKAFTQKIKEEQLNQESLEFKKEAVEDRMTSMIQQSLFAAEIASLRRESAIIKYEKTEVVLDVLMSKYSSSGGRFDELLQVINQLYEYELEQFLAIKEFNSEILEIDRISNF